MAKPTTTPKPTSGRIFAFLGVLILIGSLVPAPFLLESAEALPFLADEPKFTVTGSDFRTEDGREEIFGIDAIAYLVLEDTSFSVPGYRGYVSLRINSTEHPAWVHLDLLETGIGTGVFQGGFGFTAGNSESAAPHPLFGRIGVDATGVSSIAKVGVNSTDKGGQSIDIEVKVGHDWKSLDSITWFPAFSPTFEILLDGDTIEPPFVLHELNTDYTIQITDPDLAFGGNTGLATDALLRVVTETNPVGLQIPLERDAIDDAVLTGIFNLTKISPVDGQIRVSEGDRVLFFYTETFNERGEQQVHSFPSGGATFRQTDGIQIEVHPGPYFGETKNTNHPGFDRATILVHDSVEGANSVAGIGSVTVTVDGEEFDAVQSGKGSPRFFTTVNFTSESPLPDGFISVGSSQKTITVEYQDEVETFEWFPLRDAHLDVRRGGVVDYLVGGGLTTIRMTDADSAGKGSVQVRIKSDSDTTNGFPLSLVEISRGTFQGHFTIGSGSNHVSLADGDWLVAEYIDHLTADGSQQAIRSAPVQYFAQGPAPQPVDATEIGSARFLAADQSTELTEARHGETVFLEITAPEHEAASAIKVSLFSDHCDAEAIPTVLREASAGVFRAPLLITQTDSCNSPQTNVVQVSSDLGRVTTNGYVAFETIQLVHEGEILAFLLWHPAGNERLSATKAFGVGEFTIQFTGLDVKETWLVNGAAEQDGNEFKFSQIPGSHQVYVGRTATDSSDGPWENITIEDTNLAGGNKGRFPDCSGILSIGVDWEIPDDGVPIIGDPGDDGTVESDCNRVSKTTEGHWLVEFDPISCPSGADCDNLEVVYLAKAEAIAAGDCTGAPSHAYHNTTAGIEFCTSPPVTVQIDYASVERLIEGVTVDHDPESVTLTYIGHDDGVPVFDGTFAPWFPTTSTNPRDVVFRYSDAGSTVQDHFRSVVAQTSWRPAETAELRFRNHAFDGPAPVPFYGPGIPVEVTDKDSSHPERIDVIHATWNTTSLAREDVYLLETGTNTGVFKGVIDASGLTQKTEVQFNYLDSHTADDVGIEFNTTIEWRPSADADLVLCRNASCSQLQTGEFRGLGDRFFIKVTDEDRIHESSIQVRVHSESDVLGEVITLSRQGSGPDAFFVSGEVRFESTLTPGNGRIFVDPARGGETVTVTYIDPMNAEGIIETHTESRGWQPVNDGSIRFDRQTHVGTMPGAATIAPADLTSAQKLARATITLTDPDRAVKRDEVNSFNDLVEITSTDGGSLPALQFVETGLGTGAFIAVFGFNCAPNLLIPCLDATHTDVITATYSDPDPVSHPEVAAQAFWYSDGWGVVSFDRPGYPSITDTPRVFVYDADLKNRGYVEVELTSNTDSQGIPLNLTEDGTDKGLFTAEITLRTTGSSSATKKEILVSADGVDTLRVEYEDEEPAGVRSATAVVGAGQAPVTTLVTTPSVPGGENDWFVSPVQIAFETDRPVDQILETRYTINGAQRPIFLPGSNPVALSEEDGPVYEIEFWSIPIVGDPEEPRKETIKVSLNPPDITVQDLTATSGPGGEVELEWSVVPGKQGPPSLGYRVYRMEANQSADQAVVAGNATGESFTDLPPSAEDPPQLGETFSYFLRVVNEAGQVGPVSTTVEALSDRVAPRLVSFEVDKTELHEELGEDTINATLVLEDDAVNLEDTQKVFLRVVDPFGEVEAEIDMDSTDNITYTATYTEFDTCGVYNLYGVAADAVGNEGLINHTVRFIGLDRDPPQLRDVATEILQGQDLNVTVVDNCAGVASVSYTINDGTEREVTVPARQLGDNCTPGPCEVNFQIPADRLSLGENRIVFHLADANETANEATITHTVRMILPDESDEEEEDPLAPPSIDRDTFSSLVEHGGRFSFQVTGSGLTRIGFEVTGLDDRDVLGGLDSTNRVRVDVSELEPGQHTVVVRATNPFGTDRAEFTFFVLDEGVPLPPVNVQVSKDSAGRPVVSWQANPDSQVEVGGYLIHRSSSPWSVIGVVGAQETSFTDLTALPRTQYQYAVTAYGAGGQGLLSIGDDSEGFPWFQGVRGTTFQTDDIGEGIPPILLWVVLVVLAVLVVVGLLYATRRQIFGRGDEELYTEDYPDEAETPFGEERHMLSCPNCSTEFHVNGERPVVTNCPNCGRKGILR
jgi:hypothetical protein